MSNPKISIVTANKNSGHFLRETIESILAQDFNDFEHIIVDGASTDDSLEIIKSYPHIRWISEPDSSALEGFLKAVQMARGKYIMTMSVSDKYMSHTWFRRCVEVLDADIDISMVWGIGAEMNEEGDIIQLSHPWGPQIRPPQKQDFLPLWLASNRHAYLPELNYCVRREVYLKCYLNSQSQEIFPTYDPLLAILFNFHRNGYLPFFLSIVAHCGRIHDGQISRFGQSNNLRRTKIFLRKLCTQYLIDILLGRKEHFFRNGESVVIGRLSRSEKMQLPFSIIRSWIDILSNLTFRSGKVRRSVRILFGG